MRSPLLTKGRFSGWGGDGRRAHNVTVRHGTVSGVGGWVEVETTTKEFRIDESNLVAMLIGRDLPRRLTFPVTSTVTKGRISMKVNGRRRSLTMYKCGTEAIITARAQARWFSVR